LRELLEAISFAARESELVDNKSGVSARLSITALENLYSTAERRMLLNGEKSTTARLTDFWGIVPAITGKIELVYEGEQEGPYNVAMQLFGIAVKAVFLEYFPNPEEMPVKRTEKDPYGTIRAWFSGSNTLELVNDSNDKTFKKEIEKVAGLRRLVEATEIPEKETCVFMELVLHGLAEFNIIQKDVLDQSFSFSDPLADMMDDFDERNN
jgi:magnesium chelatase subunit I